MKRIAAVLITLLIGAAFVAAAIVVTMQSPPQLFRLNAELKAQG